MPRLNQIVAVEKGVRSKSQAALTRVYHRAQQNVLFSGLDRTYRPRSEEGTQLPPERQNVQLTGQQALNEAKDAMVHLFDTLYTKDRANQETSADIMVEGETLVEAAPVPFILWMEKQLVDIRTFVSKIPVLDPAERWEYDGQAGAWRSEPTMTTRAQKVPRAHVLYEATDKHPAQVQSYTEDVIIGDWTLVKFSGAIPADRRKQLLERVDVLIDATRFARETANSAEVTNRECGEAVFNYLFAE